MHEDDTQVSLWSRWYSAGFNAPDGAGVLHASPVSRRAPGLDVTVEKIRSAPLTVAALLAQRAADPEVVRAATRDSRLRVRVAALMNPRCPAESVRDVVLDSNPIPSLPASVAARLQVDMLVMLVSRRGPMVAPSIGWKLPLPSSALVEIVESTQPSQVQLLCSRVVWPALAHWLRYGDSGYTFDVAAVLDAISRCAGGLETAAADLEKILRVALLAGAYRERPRIGREIAGRVAALFEAGSALGVVFDMQLTIEPQHVDVEAVEVFAASGHVTLYRWAMAASSTHDRFEIVLRYVNTSESHVETLMSWCAANDPSEVLRYVDADTRVLFAQAAAASTDSLGARKAASYAFNDPAVPVALRADLWLYTTGVTALALTGAVRETWLEVCRRALGENDGHSDTAAKALLLALKYPALAAQNREVVWKLLDRVCDVLSGQWPHGVAVTSSQVARLLREASHPPSDRLCRWLLWFPELVAATASGDFGTCLTPGAATQLLLDVLAMDRSDGGSRASQIAGMFADEIDQDSAGRTLLEGIPGAVAVMVAAAQDRLEVLSPLADRLFAASVSADRWHLAEELANGWPGTLDELIAAVKAV